MHAHTGTIETLVKGLLVREATPEDAGSCARIFYEAFESIATRHNLPVEPSSPEFTRFKVARCSGAAGSPDSSPSAPAK